MSQEHGNVFFISLVIVVVAILVGLFGNRLINKFHSSETSAQLSNQANLTAPSSVTSVIHPLVKADDVSISASGDYAVGGKNLHWNITLPKKGGAINGSVSGLCDGTLNGIMATPDASNQSKISGQVKGECSIIPGIPWKSDLTATFDGRVYLNDGKIDINYEVTSPTSLKGFFSLPIKS